MITTKNGYTFVDRYGKDLTVGDRVRAQHCTGRYGETSIVEGILLRIGDHTDTYIDAPGGDCIYPGFSPVGGKVLRGYLKHEDYEHGHEQWIEKVSND